MQSVSITTPGIGIGSTLSIDGKEIKGVFSISISIEVGNLSLLTVKRYPCKSDQIIGELESKPDCLIVETFAFKGDLTFDGELVGGLWRPE